MIRIKKVKKVKEREKIMMIKNIKLKKLCLKELLNLLNITPNLSTCLLLTEINSLNSIKVLLHQSQNKKEIFMLQKMKKEITKLMKQY
jgi:hypothetical protein